MLNRQVVRAFCKAAYALLDIPPAVKLGRIDPPKDWRELVYRLTEHYCECVGVVPGGGPCRDRRTWLEKTVYARDLLSGLWANGPKVWATDDLELAAALQFLSEELHWPERR